MNVKLTLYCSLVLDPVAWKQDAFQHPCDCLEAYACPLSTIMSPKQSANIKRALINHGGFSVTTQEKVSRPTFPAGGKKNFIFQPQNTCQRIFDLFVLVQVVIFLSMWQEYCS